MKKFLFSLSLSFISILLFAQSKITNETISDTPQEEFERCSTMKVFEEALRNNPNGETLEQFESWLQQKIREAKMKPKGTQRTVITIPYIIHVIHNGEAVGTASNIPSTWIAAQMAAMNRDFRYNNADKINLPAVFQPVAADFEIEFCPAVVDPTGAILAEPGVDRVNRVTKGFSAPPYSSGTFDASVKPATIWNTDNYFNIWTANVGTSLLGYATFPSTTLLSGLTSSIGTATTDGVVVSYLAFGDLNPGLTANFNKGRTLVHEAGHWLGLRHIWGDGSCATDYCNDTPTQSASNTGCPTFPKVTCSNGPNGDMFYNYMDYSYDACMYCFTADQKTRAVTIMNNSPRRLSLLSSTVCALPGINIGVTAVNPPCTNGAAQAVTVTIKNKGITDILPGEVTTVLNVSGGVTGTYTAVANATTIPTNGTETLTFTNVNLNTTANVTLQAVATLSGDTNIADNTLAATVNLAPPTMTTSVTTACSGVAFNLVLSNPNSTATATQWQSSTNGTTYTNIAGGTTTTFATSQTVATYYRCKVTCGGTDYFSNVTQVAMNVPTNCYCAATYTTGCTSGADAITKVVYGSLSNTSVCGTSASGFYTFYSALAVPTIYKTVANNISVTFGSNANQFCSVWIDYNQDGVFVTTEQVAASTVNAGANGTFTGAITIPITALSGQTRMRVRGGNNSALTNAQACGTSSSNSGETEDYLVFITDACNTPTIGTISPITQNSATIPLVCVGCSGTYIIEYGLSGFVPGTGATAGVNGTIVTTATLSAILTGLLPGTSYDVYVRQTCPASGLMSANTTKRVFSTLCNAATLPYAEGFNTGTVSPCWTSGLVTAGAVSPIVTLATAGASPSLTVPEGARMIKFNSFNATAGAQWRLGSPSFNTTGLTSLDVSFLMAENNAVLTAMDKVTLQYSIDNGATWLNVVDNVRANANAGTATWYQRSFTLPAGAANQANMKVGLLFTSALGNNIFLDDFKIYETPAIANTNNNTCSSFTLNNVSGVNTFRIKNASNQTLAEIKPNGVNLGTVTLEMKENLAGSANVPTLTNNLQYLPRYFNINATAANPFAQNVNVKLFFHNNELDDLNAATGASDDAYTLTLVGYDDPNVGGTTENCNPNDNVTSSDTIPVLGIDFPSNGFAYNFNTNHFTEFGVLPTATTTVTPTPSLQAKVFLSSYNTSTGLMPTDITAVSNFPLTDPYKDVSFSSVYSHVANTLNASATATTINNNAIVDWVFVELRTGASGSTSVAYTKTALLQADGDVVDMDGVSALSLTGVPAGNYFVAIRHRNHLGFRTDATQALSGTATLLNFTNNSIPLYGITPLAPASATVSIMNGGDASKDGSIDSADSAIWEAENGAFDNYWLNSDYNLDASIDGVDSAIWELNNGKYQELD
jgi:hypothetical protein